MTPWMETGTGTAPTTTTGPSFTRSRRKKKQKEGTDDCRGQVAYVPPPSVEDKKETEKEGTDPFLKVEKRIIVPGESTGLSPFPQTANKSEEKNSPHLQVDVSEDHPREIPSSKVARERGISSRAHCVETPPRTHLTTASRREGHEREDAEERDEQREEGVSGSDRLSRVKGEEEEETDGGELTEEERRVSLRARALLENAVEIWQESGPGVGIAGGRQQARRHREACIVILGSYIRELKDLRKNRGKGSETLVDRRGSLPPSSSHPRALRFSKGRRYVGAGERPEGEGRKPHLPSSGASPSWGGEEVEEHRREEEASQGRSSAERERLSGRVKSVLQSTTREDEDLLREKRLQFVKKRIKEYQIRLQATLSSSHS